jgi:hypothetical protein
MSAKKAGWRVLAGCDGSAHPVSLLWARATLKRHVPKCPRMSHAQCFSGPVQLKICTPSTSRASQGMRAVARVLEASLLGVGIGLLLVNGVIAA